MRNPQDFMNAASNIEYTFNWFYTDDKHIAYFNSGLNPVRAPHTDPLFPSWAKYPWRGYHPAAAMTPASLTETQTPQKAHPQAIDQSFLTSWNNKQAPGYNDAATGQQYSSVFRSQLLDNNINHYLASTTASSARRPDQRDGHRRHAGPARRRGAAVRAEADRHPKNPTLATAVAELKAWVASGAHRINREHPGAVGRLRPERRGADHGRLVAAAGQGRVPAGPGPDAARPDRERLPDQRRARPRRLGSPPRLGVRRRLLRDRPEGPARRAGQAGPRAAEPRLLRQGLARACRAALQASLAQAVGESPQQVYPADSVCSAGDQMCSDSIQFKPIGAISQPLIEWINRPDLPAGRRDPESRPQVALPVSAPPSQGAKPAWSGICQARGRGASILIRPRHTAPCEFPLSSGFFLINERLKLQV